MLTGDKGETAHTIGIACGLIDDKADQVFMIESTTKEEVMNDVRIISSKLRELGQYNQSMSMKDAAQKNEVNDTEIEMIETGKDAKFTAQRRASVTASMSMRHVDIKKQAADLKTNVCLLINGPSLSIIFSDEQLQKVISQLFSISKSVIVFRSSPDEKAQCVKFIIKNEPGSFTLAIGDGANDVNMIQSAHIGIGIMGKEGNMAAAFSDYAIPEY